ncbi:unnamed protein product [Effrenium voratum]|nr:unnamed protein product [Effrenium voratum]
MVIDLLLRSPAAGQSDYRDFEDGAGARDQSARQQSRRSSLDSPSERLPARRRAQNRTTAGGTRPEVDFGFRPDGAGEESVESWSLFKVNKAPPEPDRTQKKGLVRNPRNADTNFGEYMSQLQQSSQEMWHSTSAPELPKNRVLPDLTKNHSQQALTQLNWTNRRWKASRR